MSASKSTDTQREKSLSRWDSEGGAGLQCPQQSEAPSGLPSEIPELNNAELVQLRIRVIALENPMIALLAQASDVQLERARGMTKFILPRRGTAQHPLTIHAADQMIDLVDRAGHFREVTPP